MNKKKKPSAFEQALSRIQGESTALAGIAQQTSIPVLNDFFTEALNMFNTKKNRLLNIEPPQPRARKGANEIASLTNGGILLSDGTVKQTPASQRLETLRKNTLDQNGFTPQARAYLETIPLDYSTPPGAYGVYSNRKVFNAPATKRIGVNPDAFNAGPTTPTEVMTHEFMHALDANINADSFASFQPDGDKSGDSYGFQPNLRKTESSDINKSLENFLSGYPTYKQFGDEYVADTESFAQYGAPKGNKVLLGPLKNSYGNIFTPASQNLNYSPAYPTNNTWKSLFKQLQTEDEFNG